MGEEFITQLVLLLVEWYLNRKVSAAKQQNSSSVVIIGSIYIIEDKDDRN